ncbi:hypothetical protein A9Q84_09155 [Halobacteriovorax marinus]|uniref:Uncharacterized protein n=1 Tax=Halobacteriovorax marinus TaxID=97084 RepID=A0A1Y5F6H6_9BACT|nr:hypothetical protein A9Q84_09155 [Halobacteriovorax marinus]
MKKLSLSTFSLFLFCLCLRGYSFYSYVKLREKVTTTHGFLQEDKKKTIALLNTLNDLTLPSQMTDRTIASTKSKLSLQHESLTLTFIEDFYDSSNNLNHLRELQKQLQDANLELGQRDNALELWTLEFVYYLVIRENFDLVDFRKVAKIGDFGFNSEEISRMKEVALSQVFKEEILNFKNVPTHLIEEELRSKDNTLERLEKHNLNLANLNETEGEEEEQTPKLKSFEDLPEDVKEQIYLAENENIDLEDKLIEMDYTEEEVDEIINGYQY